jgi:DNA recombination protein Rad52
MDEEKKKVEDVPATPEEAERREADRVDEHEPEVRPDELGAGIGQPVWASPLSEEVVEELRAPLDPNRIRRRKGRGGGQFEYLAGHDDKRRANELFGFGNWGYRVDRLEESARVEVVSEKGKEGWHISYMAIVEVTVRGCLPFSDVGYGDGVEYGPAALAQARELATKEAVTDALKRALTGWGDQFGLILYAKADEKQRIQRDADADSSRPVVRQEHAGKPAGAPQSWSEIGDRFARVLGGTETDKETASWFINEAITTKFGVAPGELEQGGQRREAFVLCASAVMQIEEDFGDLAFTIGVRDTIARVFSERLDGLKLAGPPWRLDPEEKDLPQHEKEVAKLPAPAEPEPAEAP